MAIFRKNIAIDDYVEIPNAGRILSVAASRDGSSGTIDVWFEQPWAIDDTTKPQAIWIFGTGHGTPWTPYTRHAWRFIGTVVTPSGLVRHVFWGPRKGEPVPS